MKLLIKQIIDWIIDFIQSSIFQQKRQELKEKIAEEKKSLEELKEDTNAKTSKYNDLMRRYRNSKPDNSGK